MPQLENCVMNGDDIINGDADELGGNEAFFL
jgi:hypothetical protein